MRRILVYTAVLLCSAFMLFSGCSKVNKENYDMLKIGMDYAEVEEILGKPNHCDSVIRSKRCTWGNEDRYIKTAFIADKVIFFESKGL